MADFVAVIRKAVDGLANNTPENRAKVYEKARGAVVRQLENMKPRPPEELLRRQITKLDSAIAEVESEFAEALPALEEDDGGVAPEAVEAAAPSYHEPEEVAAEPEHHVAEAADYEEERSEPVYEEPAHETRYEEPVAPAEPVHEEPAYEEPVHEEEPARADASHEVRYEEPEELYDAPEPVHAVERQEPQREEIGTYFTSAHEEPAHQRHEELYADEGDHAVEVQPVTAQADESVPAHWAQPVDEDDWRRLDEAAADEQRQDGEQLPENGFDDRNEAGHRPYAAAPVVAFEPEKRDEYGFADHRADVDHDPVFGGRDDFAAPRHDEEAPPKKAAVVEDFSTYFQDTDIDLPAGRGSSMPRASNDPFETPKDAKDAKERTPWDDLDDLIGYDGASPSNRAASDDAPAVGAGAATTPAYMVKKKPRRSYASVLLAVAGAALLVGGGYAMWANRDALNDMVGGLVQSAGNGDGQTAQPSTDTAQSQTPATTPPAAQQPPAGQQPPNQRPDNGDDGSVTGTKFTQRLLADGTERDEGPAAGANGQPMTAEGQSVYEQNVAPPAVTDAPAANGAAPAGTTPPAQQAQAPAASGERMFLYEEVLGQTVPTAIQGSVSWTLQQENDSEGRPSPTVQGQLTVPGRGLSALITFKRNTDPSLPASHLIEIVFSVAPGFEGGAIDSVQRIAMKSTEQDRGNALIAVPAKITDDFHMIALNDFPDAMKTNLELLKTRNWIDIPVSYRNGRRALLTLQKGPEGIAAFDAALRDWAAATPATGQ
ncbi:hypothetical protein [Agrobacterium tumefaciens]|uniref:hypothetical protein n=1 Tax=Agrobacterium tumefaciens TaxID=358 RepID=UPI00287C572B|nr:hypothetical protein [Agrobacterium tumefaciens]MDS7597862.1 hypothetical protein [Agrobacterium tumefaciens]